MDHVDISDHSSKEAVTVINQNGLANSKEEDLTDNEIESEWNWEQEGKESEEIFEDDGIKMEMQPLEILEEKLQISTRSLSLKEKPAVVTRPKIDDNIDDLDIKNKKLTKLEEKAEDFFSNFDMTPTIQKVSQPIVTVETDITLKPETSSSSRLQMSMAAAPADDNDGWGEDWNDEL